MSHIAQKQVTPLVIVVSVLTRMVVTTEQATISMIALKYVAAK